MSKCVCADNQIYGACEHTRPGIFSGGVAEQEPDPIDLDKVRLALLAPWRECNVCTGRSPSWDGHDSNPPCRGWLFEQIPALATELAATRQALTRATERNLVLEALGASAEQVYEKWLAAEGALVTARADALREAADYIEAHCQDVQLIDDEVMNSQEKMLALMGADSWLRVRAAALMEGQQ